MQYTFAIWVATFSTICAGQGIGLTDLPDCAKPCAATLPANCGISVQCICSDKDWITGISCCVKSKCPPADQQKTIQVAQQICDTVKVTLPSAATCPGDASSTGASTGGFIDHDRIIDDGFQYHEQYEWFDNGGYEPNLLVG
ncbi:MAG: hypothetical protein Q9218_000029 [Villophora microphyllina]